MTSRPLVPGAPAAGHVTDGGHWHPGTADGCVKCPARLDAAAWTCWRDPGHDDVMIHHAGWPQCRLCGAAPAYHERPGYLPVDFRLPVYVPVPGAPWAGTFVAVRSGIVGQPGPANGDRTGIHYEGWVHGPAQYADRDAFGLWQAGVEHAASRAVTGYPTSALASVPTADLITVADYDPTTRRLDLFDRAAVEAWLDR